MTCLQQQIPVSNTILGLFKQTFLTVSSLRAMPLTHSQITNFNKIVFMLFMGFLNATKTEKIINSRCWLSVYMPWGGESLIPDLSEICNSLQINF